MTAASCLTFESEAFPVIRRDDAGAGAPATKQRRRRERRAPANAGIDTGQMMVGRFFLFAAWCALLWCLQVNPGLSRDAAVEADDSVWTAIIPDAFPHYVYTWRMSPDGSYREDGRMPQAAGRSRPRFPDIGDATGRAWFYGRRATRLCSTEWCSEIAMRARCIWAAAPFPAFAPPKAKAARALRQRGWRRDDAMTGLIGRPRHDRPAHPSTVGDTRITCSADRGALPQSPK